MSEPFVGEIKMFAGNFAPRGWAFCDGQLLSVSSNDALFALLGTIYGGDGRTTFGLPDLRGRIPMHMGTGPGLSPRNIGAKFGAEQVTLTASQLPSHTHALATATARTTDRPSGVAAPGGHYGAPDGGGSPGPTLGAVGGGQPHTNMPPFQTVNFIIALVGIFPSRT